MIWATPEFPSPPWVLVGHSTSEPLPSVHTPLPSAPDAASRNLVKFSVVPEPSARCTTAIGAAGRSASGLSAAIAGSFHVVIWVWKILAIVSGDSLRPSTPGTL